MGSLASKCETTGGMSISDGGGRAVHARHHSIDRSDDVHYQATLLRAWEQDYAQLQAGRFAGSVSTLRNGSVKLFCEEMNRSTLQVGALPASRLAFGLPLRATGRSTICGESCDENSLIVFSGSSGFEFHSPADFEFFGIEIDPQCCDDPIFGSMVASLSRSISLAPRAIPLGSTRAKNLGSLLRAALNDQSVRRLLLDRDDIAHSFNRSLVGWLLEILPDVELPNERNSIRHWDTINEIRRLIVESSSCPVSIAELTAELGISRRTLQNACHSTLGLRPIQYLRTLRLNEARRMLRHANSVTEAATQLGFWHLGYFARDYQVMFGELPSKTHEVYRTRTA